MNYLKEIRKKISKNIVLMVLHIALVSTLLFFVNTTIHFASTHSESFREVAFEEVFEGKKLYTLMDYLFGYEYVTFRENPDSVRMLAYFHDTLNQQESFLFMSRMSTFISMHTPTESKYILTDNGDQLMYAFYMNENLFYFYSLQTQEESQAIIWQDVDYNSERIPVLLGYNFKEFYTVGDVLYAEHIYPKHELEVVGFLAAFSTIYFQNNFNYSLDDYIIVPFPPSLLELLDISVEEDVVSTLAHVMLNADIVVDSAQGLTINSLVELLGTIARRTGYEHYIFMGMSIRISQLASMVSLVYRTQTLIIWILALSIGLTSLVLIYLAKIYLERSERTYLAYWNCGAEQKFILRLIAFDIGMPLIISFIISFYFSESEYRIEWVPRWAFLIGGHHYISVLILISFFLTSHYYTKRKVVKL